MSTPLILLVTLCYVLTSIDLVASGKLGYALMFFAYALANVGVIWSLNE